MLIDDINKTYARHHKNFEDAFWSEKMALADASSEKLETHQKVLNDYLNNPELLAQIEAALASNPDDIQFKILNMMKKTFQLYIMDPETKEINDKIIALETVLEAKRNTMKLGYTHPETGEFKECSSVSLSIIMCTDKDEGVRKACYDGLVAIGDYIVDDLIEIVKLRNQMAKKLGFIDYYDYCVTRAEGFNKETLFKILDDLKDKTAAVLKECLDGIVAEHGDAILDPWNFRYKTSGDLIAENDPYHPFEDCISRWVDTFSRMGIDYQDARIQVDLCDRKNKYSNGFCHWPVCTYNDVVTGKRIVSEGNFTALATPNEIGSGGSGMSTLLHEGGHAAHFANVDQNSPLFCQERPPSSVPYAETQSMFLESVMGDAEWLARYAKDRQGNVIPWDLIARGIKIGHPKKVLFARALLVVPYFEKALYELSDDELTRENVKALAKKVDFEINQRVGGRPLLTVPHILSNEASCYYHGYVLAEMAVQQTREYFLEKYGHITDNPIVGKEMAYIYWRPGNAGKFMDVVAELTGKPFSADAIVNQMSRPLEDVLSYQQTRYNTVLNTLETTDHVKDINMTLKIVHGDKVIFEGRDMIEAAETYRKWILKTYYKQ